jgi:hypothetical protein
VLHKSVILIGYRQAVRWKLYNIAELRQHPKKHKAALIKLEKCLGL